MHVFPATVYNPKKKVPHIWPVVFPKRTEQTTVQLPYIKFRHSDVRHFEYISIWEKTEKIGQFSVNRPNFKKKQLVQPYSL